MKHILFFYTLGILLFALGFQLNAQKKLVYAFDEIPENLLKNSNAVIREDITRFEVINIGKGKSYTKYAVTILNKKADHFAEVTVYYDSKTFNNSAISGKVYDKTGKLVKQLKSKDIKDYSAYDRISIATDNRIKYFDLRYPDYPYTIEYEVEKVMDGILSFPGWVPYSGFNISSQKSSLEFTVPANYDFRYQELNIEPTAKELMVKDKKNISWSFGHFEAITREPRMPSIKYILPTVLTAPSEFEMEGYAGNMKDWASFGMWERMLNEGRDFLPEDIAVKIRAIVADEPSRTEKIRKIYEYLQANTRYISIQLGIGGWQSFPATDVATKGYGDCKALSNYMKAMLKTVDIESYYTLVKAGHNATNIDKNFTRNQFNHMILCVPNYQDTVWLECTSQDSPFGYLGSFTGDRDVLVINENGGNIVHTKVYGKEDNRQIQNANMMLHENGSASVNLTVVCTGLQYDHYSGLLDVGEVKQKKWLYDHLDLKGFELLDFKFDQKKQVIPEVSAEINVSIKRFASVSGKRLFLQPNIINKSSKISIPKKERKYDFVLDYPFEDSDTIRIQIPDGYHLEYIPEKVSIESPFGSYESQVISEEGKITYLRSYSLVKETFPPEEYINFVKFINKVATADKAKLVLVKST